jgi:hypothetical protein
LIQKSAGDIYTNVAQQFSGAGRTPTSPLAQQQVTSQVAQAALPLAFQQYDQERARQLAIASQAPSVLQTGQQLEQIPKTTKLSTSSSLTTICWFSFTYCIRLSCNSRSSRYKSKPINNCSRRSNLWFSFRF